MFPSTAAARLSRPLRPHRRLLAMATTHSPSVAKREAVANAPPTADRTAHHVRDGHGRLVKFRNPHPSFGETLSQFQMFWSFTRLAPSPPSSLPRVPIRSHPAAAPS